MREPGGVLYNARKAQECLAPNWRISSAERRQNTSLVDSVMSHKAPTFRFSKAVRNRQILDCRKLRFGNAAQTRVSPRPSNGLVSTACAPRRALPQASATCATSALARLRQWGVTRVPSRDPCRRAMPANARTWALGLGCRMAPLSNSAPHWRKLMLGFFPSWSVRDRPTPQNPLSRINLAGSTKVRRKPSLRARLKPSCSEHRICGTPPAKPGRTCIC